MFSCCVYHYKSKAVTFYAAGKRNFNHGYNDSGTSAVQKVLKCCSSVPLHVCRFEIRLINANSAYEGMNSFSLVSDFLKSKEN